MILGPLAHHTSSTLPRCCLRLLEAGLPSDPDREDVSAGGRPKGSHVTVVLLNTDVDLDMSTVTFPLLLATDPELRLPVHLALTLLDLLPPHNQLHFW